MSVDYQKACYAEALRRIAEHATTIEDARGLARNALKVDERGAYQSSAQRGFGWNRYGELD